MDISLTSFYGIKIGTRKEMNEIIVLVRQKFPDQYEKLLATYNGVSVGVSDSVGASVSVGVSVSGAEPSYDEDESILEKIASILGLTYESYPHYCFSDTQTRYTVEGKNRIIKDTPLQNFGFIGVSVDENTALCEGIQTACLDYDPTDKNSCKTMTFTISCEPPSVDLKKKVDAMIGTLKPYSFFIPSVDTLGL